MTKDKTSNMNSKKNPADPEDDILMGLGEEFIESMQDHEETFERQKQIEVPASRRTVERTASVTQIRRRDERQAHGAEAEALDRVLGTGRAPINQDIYNSGATAPRRQTEPIPDEESVDPAGNKKRENDRENNSAKETTARNRAKLKLELGPLREILKRRTVSDIFRNPDGSMFVNETGYGTYMLDRNLWMDNVQAMSLIGTVASLAGVSTDEDHPYVETMLPEGAARFSAVRPPYVSPGPMFSIRRPSPQEKTLDDYINDGSLSNGFAKAIRMGIRLQLNILIVGGTGSGKTTLANAIFAEIAESAPGPNERFMILEDTPELVCNAENVVCMQVGPHMDMTSLLARCMRHSPTNISVGELRGPEAYVLIKAWNTGHSGGITTIHAPDARRALTRLESLVKEAGHIPSREEVSAAIGMIVVIRKDAKGQRKISEVKRIEAPSGTDYKLVDP